jgi:hypothetical protein
MDFAAGVLSVQGPLPSFDPHTPQSPPPYTLYTVYLLTQGRGGGAN